jgi:hypothetical protein
MLSNPRKQGVFRFGYGKAVNDKKVADRAGSEVFVLQKLFVRPITSLGRAGII